MTKILLFGSGGQVGTALQHSLQSLGTLIAIDVPQIDFGTPESLRQIVRDVRPDVVVNAAAYTAVDKAESNAAAAFAVNAEAPAVLAQEAETLNAILVHYSTDYVFAGMGDSPQGELDQTAPLSVYGASKRDGELAVKACSRRLVFRTSWVVSAHGHNFIKTILRLAREREHLRVVSDQFGAPTTANLLADTTATILGQMLTKPASDPRWGLYHLVASGETSWHGLACYVVSRARQLGLPVMVEPESVTAITTAEFQTEAKRPLNSRLDTSKLRSTFGVNLPDWKVGVDNVVEQLAREACA